MNMKLTTLLFCVTALAACAHTENPKKNMTKDLTASLTGSSITANADTATFGTGCFWCTEAIFQQVEGVLKVSSGYSGGHVANPTYKEVCEGTTGHAECIQVVYDPQ